jgi:hypothetical protein
VAGKPPTSLSNSAAAIAYEQAEAPGARHDEYVGEIDGQ